MNDSATFFEFNIVILVDLGLNLANEFRGLVEDFGDALLFHAQVILVFVISHLLVGQDFDVLGSLLHFFGEILLVEFLTI